MVRYLLGFEYVGTAFRGASRVASDSSIPAVQNVLESALVKLNRAQAVRTALSSRTDADVHALCNTMHVDIDRGVDKPAYSPETIMNAVNHYMRKAYPVRVHTVYRVPDNFHARYFATGRTYVYRISANCKFLTVFERHRSYSIPHRLDVDAMKRGAEVFVGLHDFTTFSRESAKTNMWKTMERAEVRDGRGYAIPSCDDETQYIELEFKSKSFLYHQVRLMTGALVDVGSHKISPDELRIQLKACSRRLPIRMAPGYGLYLTNVSYSNHDIVYGTVSSHLGLT